MHGITMVSRRYRYLRAGEYTIETATHGMVAATLHTEPLFDPNGDRVKGIY